ncbi:MAG: methyltransferase domain-containing protein [Deltaproteobacteria bacterium]|nr:methyltransferase domain-containing protein [Deltaproteobacteria bacterium]
MRDSTASGPLPSQLLQERYGRGYFHGENSGFAREGYGTVHATWQHWMPFLREQLGTGARLLDLGCAYGFLVVEALDAGFDAIGVDASRFAIGEAAAWARPAVGRLLAAHAERVPFADASFDVVTAFDVLEHVPRPELLLVEAARVLRPGGLLVGATPDPLLFERSEETHVAEHVPSWWVRELERAGFSVSLRFFQAAWNLEIVARRGAPAPPISYDALGTGDPVVRGADDAPRFALRSGFGEPTAERTRVVGNGALVYVLNPGDAPLALELEIDLAEPASVSLALDGRVVGRTRGEATTLRARALLPAGGHQLRFEIPSGWAWLRTIAARAAPATREQLCLTLPFDMYERYALVAETLRRIAPGADAVLDVGGTMGGGAGHLAWTGDFLPGRDVRVVDARAADLPRHDVLDPQAPLPFADRAFPVVLALDVLEHVPAAARDAWLGELLRVAGRFLLIGNPFATPGVAEADRYLFELIRTRYGYAHGFLAEHLEHGHPDLAATRAFFAARGASVVTLPSGYLPAWILLQTVNALLSHPEQDDAYVLANESANRAIGLASTVEPAYRHLLVIDRMGADHTAALQPLVVPRTPDLDAVAAAIAALPVGGGGSR